MFIGRIEVVGGPHHGLRTYVQVQLDTDGVPHSYLPIDDPFEPHLAGRNIPAEPVAANAARLLAPCTPRVVLGMAHNTGPADRNLPPQAFHKSPHSVIGPGDDIELEANHDSVDAEAEIALVIGKTARHLTRTNALEVVLGYTLGNDVTDRAAQATDTRWTEAKSRDTYTPLGPWIRTDLDPSDVPITLGDDGDPGTLASTSGLARGAEEILVYLSSVMTLHPGDVVLTGAPGPSVRLRPGTVSRITSRAIGELRNPVVAKD